MIRGAELEKQGHLSYIHTEATAPAARVCGNWQVPGQKDPSGPELDLFEIIFFKSELFSQAVLEDQ